MREPAGHHSWGPYSAWPIRLTAGAATGYHTLENPSAPPAVQDGKDRRMMVRRRLCSWLAVLLVVSAAGAAERAAELEANLEAKLAERHRRAIALAELYESSGNWQRAAEHYQMARLIREDDAQVLTQLARIYRAHDEDAKLLPIYAALSRLQPTSVAWLRELGSCQFRLGQKQEAEAVWRRILEVQPSRTYALRHLAEIYTSHKLLDKAVAACAEALALSPNDEDLRQRLGEAIEANGDHLGALSTLSRLGPDRSVVRSYRATQTRRQALQALDLPLAARAALERCLREGPASVADLAWAVARPLEETGGGKLAAPYYRRVASEEPDTPRGKASAEKAAKLDAAPTR